MMENQHQIKLYLLVFYCNLTGEKINYSWAITYDATEVKQKLVLAL